jgi:DNA polymerase-3 subunit delta'
MSESLWAQLIGHDAVLAALARAWDGGHGAQGYLFVGAEGVGKVTAALGLAQRLNCEGDAPPCGVCPSCRRIAELAVPMPYQVPPPSPPPPPPCYREASGGQDQVWRYTPFLARGENMARNLYYPVEAMRELVTRVSRKALGQGWRFVVFDHGDCMHWQGSSDAANTLLKTLEEPPERTVFVLATSRPSAVLPTIRSRLCRLDFALVPTALTRDWLVRVHGLSSEQATVCAGVGSGRPARALELARSDEWLGLRGDLLARAAQVGAQPPVTALGLARLMIGEKRAAAERVGWALDFLDWWYRDALVLAAAGSDELVVNQDHAAELARFAAGWTPAQLSACLGAIDRTRRLLARQANPLLVLENLWLALGRGGTSAGGPDKGRARRTMEPEQA